MCEAVEITSVLGHLLIVYWWVDDNWCRGWWRVMWLLCWCRSTAGVWKSRLWCRRHNKCRGARTDRFVTRSQAVTCPGRGSCLTVWHKGSVVKVCVFLTYDIDWQINPMTQQSVDAMSWFYAFASHFLLQEWLLWINYKMASFYYFFVWNGKALCR